MPHEWKFWRITFAVWLVEYAIFSVIMFTYALFVQLNRHALDPIFKRNNEMPIATTVLALLQLVLVLIGIFAIVRRKISTYGAIFALLTLFGVTYIIFMILAGTKVITESPKFTRSIMIESFREATRVKNPARKVWINFQTTKHCCGVDHYRDWMKYHEEYWRTNSTIENSCCTDMLITALKNVYENHSACAKKKNRRYLYHRPCGPFILKAANNRDRISYDMFLSVAAFMLIITTVGIYISYRNGVHRVGNQLVFKPFSSDSALKQLVHEVLHQNLL